MYYIIDHFLFEVSNLAMYLGIIVHSSHIAQGLVEHLCILHSVFLRDEGRYSMQNQEIQVVYQFLELWHREKTCFLVVIEVEY